MSDKRCTFVTDASKKWQCGSYAFNLARDGIEQVDFCDVHYWQDRCQKAEAVTPILPEKVSLSNNSDVCTVCYGPLELVELVNPVMEGCSWRVSCFKNYGMGDTNDVDDPWPCSFDDVYGGTKEKAITNFRLQTMAISKGAP